MRRYPAFVGRLGPRQPRLAISNISIKAGQSGRIGGSLFFVFPAWRRRPPFLFGDLDFTSPDQERNGIPNEFVKLEVFS